MKTDFRNAWRTCFIRTPRIKTVLKRLCIVAGLIMLAGCYSTGRHVTGIDTAGSWFSLPFDEFLHEGDARPDAIAFCATAECPDKLVVGILTVGGESAERLERILQKPELLATELKARENKSALKRAAAKTGRQHIETKSRIEPVHHDRAMGFSIVLSRKDGKGRVSATVLGWRTGESLHLVLAIGEQDETVRETAIRVVDGQFTR